MGTYGVEWFENDAVADWMGKMEAEGHADHVRRLLERVAREPDYIDASDGQTAIAAAEVVAAVRGYPDDPQFTRKLARRMPTLTEDAALALAALSAVVDPNRSELYELIEDGPSFNEWIGLVEELRRRLGG